ncbi:MAG: DUF4956 domain-containing protein [Cyclobacteriaceae bacterium]
MFDRFLEGDKYYEYPSFEVAIFSLLLALVLSSTVALTYRFTHQGSGFPNRFFQAMVLSSLVTAMILMAVGNNIAIGFGIIGVVAIIRFRTQFQNTRNIIFMFAALSVGIATGVYGYSIALAGTSIFCGAVFLLHYSPFGHIPVFTDKIEFVVDDSQSFENAYKTLSSFVKNIQLVEIRTRENGIKYDYTCEIPKQVDWHEIAEHMKVLVNDFRIIERVIEEPM